MHALAIAASQASGLRVSFATMAKPFQAGRAASAGVLAAQLARAGVEAAPDAIEARQGLAALHAPGRDLDLESDRAGVEAVVFKPYACCGGAHGAIDATAKIVTAYRLDADAVVAVEIRVSAQMSAVCAVTEPANGVEAKFSLPHVVALVLARRSCGPSGFTDVAAAADPELARLRALVTTRPSGAATGHATEVEVSLADGTTHRAQSDPREPAADAALDDQWAVLTAKFAELVSPWCDHGRTLQLIEHVAELGSASSFVDLLRATR
jgi:2-methylcitrate dehydratase PrpD